MNDDNVVPAAAVARNHQSKHDSYITDFFQPKLQSKQVGRPRKRWCHRQESHLHTLPAVVISPMITPPLASAPSHTPSKKIHINWGKPGPNHDRMEKAIHHWFTNGEYKFDSNGEMIVDPAIFA